MMLSPVTSAPLTRLIFSIPPFWEKDFDPEGFAWLDCHQEQSCTYVLQRNGKNEHIIAEFNSSDHSRTISLNTKSRKLSPLICSDWEEFGGSSPRNKDLLIHGKTVLSCTLSPFSGAAFPA